MTHPYDPIAFTYMADVHCPSCTAETFPFDLAHNWPIEGSVDREGNEPHPIAPWETGEWMPEGISCGDCGDVIVERDHTATIEEYRAKGYEHGTAVGNWVIDGNASVQTAQKIITGYNDGDPEVMDMCGNPLSGEMAGESIPELLPDLDPNAYDDHLTAYEDGYVDGFWNEVLRSANAILPDLPVLEREDRGRR